MTTSAQKEHPPTPPVRPGLADHLSELGLALVEAQDHNVMVAIGIPFTSERYRFISLDGSGPGLSKEQAKVAGRAKPLVDKLFDDNAATLDLAKQLGSLGYAILIVGCDPGAGSVLLGVLDRRLDSHAMALLAPEGLDSHMRYELKLDAGPLPLKIFGPLITDEDE